MGIFRFFVCLFLLVLSSASLAIDTDGDGLPDAWEVANGFNKYNYTDAASDTDNDGLTALLEFYYGTSPYINDTDRDTMSDGWEIDNKLNPLSTDYLIELGKNHSCAIFNAEVVCWGENESGQTNVPELSNPTQVSAGSEHTCALDDSGVVCWGNNEHGQVDVPVLSNPTQISSGYDNTCSIDATGLVCWGSNYSNKSNVPFLSNPTEVSTGGSHTCALDDSGMVCWGYGWWFHDMPELSNPRQVSLGGSHSCVLDDSGVICRGDSYRGQADVPELSNPTQISAGSEHTCALDDSGVVCWGKNWVGQANVPELVNPAQVSAGTDHTCALDETGIVCWGSNSAGQVLVPNLIFDLDRDTANNHIDVFPLDGNETSDNDNDGIGDNADLDDDNDGVEDSQDSHPYNPLYTFDTDNDGIPDAWEIEYGLNPQDRTDAPSDLDNDGAVALQEFVEGTFPLIDADNDWLSDDYEISIGTNPNNADSDGDGVNDKDDDLPLNLSETTDTDFDGIGNNIDNDDDGDNLLDQQEIDLGLNPLSADTDKDGINDALDPSTAVIEVDFPKLKITYITPGITPLSGDLRFRSPGSIASSNYIGLKVTNSSENKAIFEYEFHPLTPSGTYVINDRGTTVIKHTDGAEIYDYEDYTFEVNNPSGVSSNPEVIEYEMTELPNNQLAFELMFSDAAGGIATQFPSNQEYLMAYVFFSFANLIESGDEPLSINLKVSNLIKVDTNSYRYSDIIDIPEPYIASEARVTRIQLFDSALNEFFAYIDSDNDLTVDELDAFPYDSNEYKDTDDDGIGDNSDNCPEIANESQSDINNDSIGDACNKDADYDGVLDVMDIEPNDATISFGVGIGNMDSFTSFDPETVPSGLVLSDENLTVSTRRASGGAQSWSILTTDSISSGKHYWEIEAKCGPDTLGFSAGFIRLEDELIESKIWAVGSDGYRADGQWLGSYGEATLSGDIFTFAVDLDAGQLFIGKNGIWSNNSDPALGHNPIYNDISGPVFARVNIGSRQCQPLPVVANFGNREFEYEVPEGYFRGFCASGECTIATYIEDYDADGMPDEYETANGLNPNNSADAESDSDQDGLTALEEFNLGTSPANNDTDQDGLTDSWENQNGINPLVLNIDIDNDDIVNELDTDNDNDGVEDNFDAFPLDPAEQLDHDNDGIGNNADTDDDGDGVNDALDLFPLDAFESADSDGDGVGDNADFFPNSAEYSLDSDLDQMPDAWERKYGLNPTDASDALLDQDNDGLTALEEYEAGTIPLKILDIDANGSFDALTDGLLVLRYAFGLRGESLIKDSIATDAMRTNPADIEAYIESLVPGL